MLLTASMTNHYTNNENHHQPSLLEERIPLNPSGREGDIDGSSKGLADGRRLDLPPKKLMGLFAIGASLISVVLCAAALLSFGLGFCTGSNEGGNRFASGWEGTDANLAADQTSSRADRQTEYAEKYYDEYGRFVLEDYDTKPPFSNFLPGLAGYYGIPLYAFYVNRGQGIASFGFKSKDYPIQEFHSANLAYQSTAFTGFRTFVQISRPRRNTKMGATTLIEPFGGLQTRFPSPCEVSGKPTNLPKRYMYIGANEMQLQEIDFINGIETNVTFFVLPEEDFGAFAKRTTITSILPGSRGNEQARREIERMGGVGGEPITVSMLDGLAKIVPAGGKMNDLLKNMGRTLEGWMGVYSPYNDTLQMPFYRLSTQPSDSAAVVEQEAGHWCLSVLESSDDRSNEDPKLLPIIHDPSKVFGDDTSLLRPIHLYSHSISEILNGEQQYGFAKTASAFAAVEDVTLNPGESFVVTTFFGKADRVLDVPVIARRLSQPGFALFKATRARELVKQITSSIETKTSNPLFDGHVQQMFLDNALRGGIPQILGDDDDSRLRCADEDERLKVYHLFSRIHGDLERDYNDFEVEPAFFSNVRFGNKVPIFSFRCRCRFTFCFLTCFFIRASCRLHTGTRKLS